MNARKKRFSVKTKIRKVLMIFCPLLLAIGFFLSVYMNILNAADTQPEAGNIVIDKTVAWTNQEKTAMDIVIGEKQAEGSTYTPNILFLGTLCDSHSLKIDTIYTALAETAEYGNVDCYLFGNGWTGGTVERLYQGTIKKLDLKRTDYSTDADYLQAKKAVIKSTSVSYQEGDAAATTKTYGDITLTGGQHASVYDFAKLLADFQKGGKKYDYIVLEFDGLRLGHTNYERKSTDESNLVAAYKWISEYYKNGSIAWIVAPLDASDDRPTTYTNKIMFNEYFFDNTQGSYVDTTPVRDCIWLLAPEDIDSDELAKTTIDGTIEDQKAFISRAKDDSDSGIWVTYDDAEKVKIFLEKRLAKYVINIEDVVAPGFDVTGVKAQYHNGTDWVDIVGNISSSLVEDYGKLTYVVGTKDATGTKVTGVLDLRMIYPDYEVADGHNVRMIISTKLTEPDESSASYIFNDTNDYQVNTNVGDVIVTNISSSVVTKNTQESPKIKRVDEYQITYVLKGGQVSTANPVTYHENTTSFTLTNPTREGYAFKGWTGGVVTAGVVSEDVKDSTSVTIAKGSSGNRQYTADWEMVPNLSITKDVKKYHADASVAGITQNAGAYLTYAITVTNNHAEEDIVVDVEDLVPEGLLLDPYSISNSGTYDDTTRKMNWTNISIPAGSAANIATNANQVILTFDVRVPSYLSVEAEFENKAYITKAGGNSYTGTGSENNTPATVKFDAVPRLTIRVGKKCSDTWENHKDDTVFVNLYAGTTLLEQLLLDYSNQLLEGVVDAVDDSGNPITYSVYEAVSGTTDADTVPEGGKVGDYQVHYEKLTEGNVTTFIVNNNYIPKPSDIAIGKTADAIFVAGSEYTYTITVKNTRAYETAENLIIEDTIDSALIDNGTALSSVAITSGEELDISGSKYTWKIKTLAPGATATLEIKIKVPDHVAAVRYNNQAKLVSMGSDSVPDEEGKSNSVQSDVPDYLTVKYQYVGEVPAGAETQLPADSTAIDYGSKYTAESVPSVPGYVFYGWCTENTCSTPYVDDSVLTSSMTLFGRFVSIKNLSIEKRVLYNDQTITENVASGNTVTYQIRVTNNNIYASAKDVVITDVVSEGLIVSDVSDGGVLDSATNTVTWTIPSVDASGEKIVSFKATISTGLKVKKTFKNVATLVSSETETLNKQTDEISFTGEPADIPLKVTLTWSDTWEEHATESVKVKLYANGIDTGKAISLTKDASSFTCMMKPYDESGTQIVYVFKELSATENDLEEGDKTGTENRYEVNYVENDPADALIQNNYIIDATDLFFNKVAETKAAPGQYFSYYLMVKNQREYETAKDIIVTDSIPEGLVLAEKDGLTVGANQTVSYENGKITWNIQSIEAQETAMLVIKVYVPADVLVKIYENVAYIHQVGETSYISDPIASPQTSTEIRTFKITNEWADTDEHEAIEVQLLQNEKAYGGIVRLSEENNWEYLWTLLPIYNENNELNIYTIEEFTVEGYDTSVSFEGPGYGNTAALTKNTKKAVVVELNMGELLPNGISSQYYENISWGDQYNPTDSFEIEGYTFSGWYLDSELTIPYKTGMRVDNTYLVEGKLQLYGKWVENTPSPGTGTGWEICLICVLLIFSTAGLYLVFRSKKKA